MNENETKTLLFCFACKKMFKTGIFCVNCGKKLLEPHSYQQKKEAIDILIEQTESKIDWCKGRHTVEIKNSFCPDCNEEYINFFKIIKRIQNVGEVIEKSFKNEKEEPSETVNTSQ